MTSATTHTTPRSPLAPSVVRILDYRQETYDTFTLTCEPPRRSSSPYSFLPGQFNMLYMLGVGEAPISMSGDPENSETVIHTIRAVGSVTSALSRLRPGHSMGVRGPYGAPWPIETAVGKDVLLVTGGIGLAPLRPLIYELLRRRSEFRQVILLHGSRTPDDLIFAEEIAAWSQRKDFQARVTVDNANISWKGDVGVVTTLFRQIEFDPANTVAFMCGPEVMMRFAIRDLRKRNLQREQMFVSLERNMQCAIGFCGHCQFGPSFVCVDGPVFRFDRIERFFDIREA